MDKLICNTDKLYNIIHLGLTLSNIQDIDMLLEKILYTSRNFVDADAGSIYIREDDKLHFRYTQNDTLNKNLEAGQKLIYTTFSIPINHASIAGYAASTGQIINIEDVYEIPEDMPYSFDKYYDKVSKYRTKSMITVPLKNVTGKIIGILQMINAKDKDGKIISFPLEDEPFIQYFASTAAIAIERAQLTRSTILRMIRMAELRDPKETGPHVTRVAAYTVELYERWANKKGIAQTEIESKKDILRIAAMLHDVGKVAISDLILKKPGKFTPEEYEIMKQHTTLGAKLFKEMQSNFDEMAIDVVLNHHERWDGNGYPGYVNYLTGEVVPGYSDANGNPRGKKGEEIPIVGRIVSVADVFDALSSHRVYKDAWDEDKVLTFMKQEKGKQFDPDLIDVFFESLDTLKAIRNRYPEA